MKSILETAIACFSVLFLDFILYGEIFPLLGLYSGSYVAAYFNFSFLAELSAVAGFSLLLFFFALAVRLEKIFWKKLYSLDDFYRIVLHVRDFCNAIYVAVFVATLVNTSFNTSLLASALKANDNNILEHPLEGFVHVLCYRIEFYTQTKFKWCEAGNYSQSYEAIYEAKVLYAVAFLCVSVAKMLYFNTLFTYLQTLKMFREMQANRAQQQTETQRQAPPRRRPRPRPVNTVAGSATVPGPPAARFGLSQPREISRSQQGTRAVDAPLDST
ncbi:unnamed protein product [Allacma fusca]|uniref:Uncharacterized protein n=1 Tax=Allacma fusca TaxID=39272 RepID=A0A8J2NQG2_9HEXA|nr:unnamed protein product [Allacma fusca]